VVKPAIIAAVLALATAAHAEPDHDPIALGVRDTFQSITLGHDKRYAGTIGVTLAHTLGGSFRGALELDGILTFQAGNADVARDAHGFGARAQLAVRTQIGRKALDEDFVLYADLELGGGVAAVRDTMLGDHLVPDAFVGLRGGYTIQMTSRWETELLLRLIAMPDGESYMFGVGFQWD
jgi:hypothetical protein